ncbi:MAG: hypothetical protein H6Q49_639, partial [Deltaproteobacteria bacterium]|nr:hypothetical protein [Deltaproteobacteria bacterium]
FYKAEEFFFFQPLAKRNALES